MPPIVNRSAVLVRRKQPYIDWANSFDDGGPKYDLSIHKPDVYLLDENFEVADLKRLLRKHWKKIFEAELGNWMQDGWPRRLTYAMFTEWFEIDQADMVWDIGKDMLFSD